MLDSRQSMHIVYAYVQPPSPERSHEQQLLLAPNTSPSPERSFCSPDSTPPDSAPPHRVGLRPALPRRTPAPPRRERDLRRPIPAAPPRRDRGSRRRIPAAVWAAIPAVRSPVAVLARAVAAVVPTPRPSSQPPSPLPPPTSSNRSVPEVLVLFPSIPICCSLPFLPPLGIGPSQALFQPSG